MSVFSQQLTEKINAYLTRYETKRSAILPILHAIQDEHGWISPEQIECLHHDFGLNRVDVLEVITFYSLYRETPPAQFEIQFCDNIVCRMLGSKPIIEKIKQRIAAYEQQGKKSPFNVEGVPCLGVCDGAPAMLVNKDRYLSVTQENIDEILDKYAPL